MGEPERRKTASRTFRVDESALRTIERDAAEAKVSVNTFVNQLFLSYTDYERYFVKSQRNPLLIDYIGYLVELLSDEGAAEAGRSVARNVIKPMILAKYGSLTLGSLLACIRLFAEYSKAFSIYESETAGRKTITVFHNWGKKGSIYYAQEATTLFEMIDLKPKITTTEKSITILI